MICYSRYFVLWICDLLFLRLHSFLDISEFKMVVLHGPAPPYLTKLLQVKAVGHYALHNRNDLLLAVSKTK